MSLADRNRAKMRCFRHLLDSGVTALHLDARMAGVQVPERFRQNPWLVLNFSYRYQVADFSFDETQAQATLTFGGVPFFCQVPWTAVFAITDDARTQGQHWPEDLPPDAHRVPAQPRAASARAKRDPDELPEKSNEVPARRGFRAIAGGKQDAEDEAADVAGAPEAEAPAAKPDGDAAPRSTSHLRRVK